MKKLLVLLVLFICINACHLGRFITKGKANITDHKIFPYTEINPGETKFKFIETPDTRIGNFMLPNNGVPIPLNQWLAEETRTTAFIIIKNDSILFEKYYRGYEADDISNIFSVSKSVTSLLVGLAVDEGKIERVDDPVTKYLPELNDADPKFQELTIKHLLNMRSGIKFKEGYTSPFAHVARLYYGTNQQKQVRKMEFEYAPGTVHKYQSISTSILGMIVERVTGMEMGKYLEQKVWQPMGMEFPATWSVDDNKNRSTKAFCCLNTTARDLAKIGKLYLDGGQWQGKQIISEEWVTQSTVPNLKNDNYQYQWYSTGGIQYNRGKEILYKDSISAVIGARASNLKHFYVDKKSEDSEEWHVHYASENFYALGILGQYVFVNPNTNLIAVRLGEKWDQNYLNIFYWINRKLLEAEKG